MNLTYNDLISLGTVEHVLNSRGLHGTAEIVHYIRETLEKDLIENKRKRRKTMVKCDTCKIMREMENSNELCCCGWYMDNVVLGNKNIEECEDYIHA